MVYYSRHVNGMLITHGENQTITDDETDSFNTIHEALNLNTTVEEKEGIFYSPIH